MSSVTLAAQTAIPCPKCGAAAREIARFCPRCHATLRYQCPSCKHEQRQGGQCEKCGVNFMKYVSAVVAAKRDQADAANEKLRRQSELIKNIALVVLTGGLSLLRPLFSSRDRR